MIRDEKSLEDLIAERIAEKMAENDQMAERLAEKILERMNGSGKRWLKMKEAAAHIQMNYQKFTELVRIGEIPSHRFAGCVRIREHELDEWAMKQ